MVLNLGPQHPATHGTLRIVARLDGEQVISADVICGYMHRGYEKLTEVRTYPQVTTLINRIDWLSSFANEVPFILAAEQLMEIEAPPRAQSIRTIMFELSRIANVTLFIGEMGVQLGALTPVFFAFRDREYVLNLIEAATGGRFHPNYDRIGGLKEDLPRGWIAETHGAMKRIRTYCDQLEDLLMGNGILRGPHPGRGRDPGRDGARLRVVGRQHPGQRGRLGPSPRRPLAPGVEPARRKVWTHPDGDSFARYWVRLQEVREATKMVDQLLDGLPAGPIQAKVPRIIKVPAGGARARAETRWARWATTSSARAGWARSG